MTEKNEVVVPVSAEDNKDKASDSALESPPEEVQAEPGMLLSVKNLYQGPKDDDGKRSWVEELPKNLDDPVENSATAQHALLVRNVKSYDGRKKLNIESIVIQSPLLRKALGKILGDYPGVKTKLERLTFEPPFAPFVHRWPRFLEFLGECEGEVKEHMTLLHDVLHEELKDAIAFRNDHLSNGVIDYKHVWMLFEPGCTVYSSTKQGQPCAVQYKSGHFAEDQCGELFGLQCQHVDWDGKKFGWASTVMKIRPFEGTLKVSELPAMPLQYCKSEKAVRKALIERGQRWEELAGYHYEHYTGTGMGRGSDGRMEAFNVNSRVIIDAYGWNKFQPSDSVYVGSLADNISDDTDSVAAVASDVSDDEYDSEWSDPEENVFRVTEEEAIFKPKDSDKPTPLTEEQKLMAASTIRAYSLKDKKWLVLTLDGVRPVTFSKTAFSSLVLEQQQKELLLALTSAQRAHKKAFDDVVQGKGQGMIMLLAGPPGVGKTLTAESIAEVLEAPLYVVGAADLGSYAYDVEANLRMILEMCARWDAVCLIDEADVFLEARSNSDLERNKLVSIFLRTLEYYEGILFMTTNRVDNIDAAFHSRIHLSLSYPDLTPASRRRVWQNFIAAAAHAPISAPPKLAGAVDDATKSEPGPSFSEEDLDKLSIFNMNGREIKNVLKTAQLLASMKDEALCFSHVKTVMNVEQRYHGRQTELRV